MTPTPLPPRLRRLHPLAAALALCAALPATAESAYWNCTGTQSWTAPCWADLLGAPTTVPGAGDYAGLVNSGANAVTAQVSTNLLGELTHVDVYSHGAGWMTLSLSPGAQFRAGQLRVGSRSGSTGKGRLLQSGGLLVTDRTTIGFDIGAQGTATVTGGTLQTRLLFVGDAGTGSFEHTAGQVQVGETLSLGTMYTTLSGSYALAGGTLQAQAMHLAYAANRHNGSFAQTAGALQAGLLGIGSTGQYQLGGSGTLTLQQLDLVHGKEGGHGGRYLQTGGQASIQAANVGGGATLSMQGGTLVTGSLMVSGRADQGGGMHLLSSTGRILDGGRYALAGGTLDTQGHLLEVQSGGTLWLGGGALKGQRLQLDGTLQAGGSGASLGITTDVGARARVQLDGGLTLDGRMNLRHNLQHPESITGAGLLTIGSSGQLLGQGVAAVAIDNRGLVQAQGGALTLSGASLSNTGLLRAAAGAQLFVDAPQVAQGGRIEVQSGGSVVFAAPVQGTAGSRITLQGGTLATPLLSQAAGATITGFGTLVGSLDNAGLAEFYGPTQIVGDLHNAAGGLLRVRNEQTLVTGQLLNEGVIELQGGTLVFEGGVAGSGGLTAAGGSRFVLGGDFALQPGDGASWHTEAAALHFGGGTHGFLLAGADRGASTAATVDNFAWARLVLEDGSGLRLADANTDAGAALYVGALVGAELGQGSVLNIEGNGYNLYYDAAVADNAYLGGRSWALQGGGQLIALAPVPEPSGAAMLMAGAGVLALLQRRRRPLRSCV